MIAMKTMIEDFFNLLCLPAKILPYTLILLLMIQGTSLGLKIRAWSHMCIWNPTIFSLYVIYWFQSY